MTLYPRQQKRHRCIEQSFGFCGRGRGWDSLGEWHGTCILSYTKRIVVQVRCMIQDAWGLVHWDDPEGWYGKGGEEGVQDG